MAQIKSITKQVPITVVDYKDKLVQIAKKQQLQIMSGNKLLEVPVRVPVGSNLVTCDAVNYVTSITPYWDDVSSNPDCHIASLWHDKEIDEAQKIRLADEFAFYVTEQLGDIFGSDFTNVTRNVKGLHGYKHQYTIGTDDCVLGKICFGGNKDTVLIMITGKGCYWALDGWELSLYEFLKNHKGHLTRIDLALDDFKGEFSSAELANEAETAEKFMLTNNRPKVQMLGDWKHHTGEGRTLQIGKRENGKMYRGYEKGKQLGDPESRWFRSEIEFKNKDRILPLEMLIQPTDYFAGAYPYAYELVEAKQKEIFQTVEKIQTMKKESEISFQKAVSVMKKQFGKYIKTFRDILPNEVDGVSQDTIICNLIQTDKHTDYVPKRLKVTDKYFEKLSKKAMLDSHCMNRPIPI